MTEQELRKEIGIKPGSLVSTNRGLLDIFSVKDNKVAYGFLAGGDVQMESVEDFLAHFGDRRLFLSGGTTIV